ncbi:CLUMA_CG021461, isoform A [Clunio marinus]|uniref:CLUMA_CG021461, isoform A n=1 Tax=Clunio marinus TaxID=568069 RepID=A0A1J1JBN1_9DIPT|nr:CLUMA_CG021461, isoform A [Clunio marinus]
MTFKLFPVAMPFLGAGFSSNHLRFSRHSTASCLLMLLHSLRLGEWVGTEEVRRELLISDEFSKETNQIAAFKRDGKSVVWNEQLISYASPLLVRTIIIAITLISAFRERQKNDFSGNLCHVVQMSLWLSLTEPQRHREMRRSTLCGKFQLWQLIRFITKPKRNIQSERKT